MGHDERIAAVGVPASAVNEATTRLWRWAPAVVSLVLLGAALEVLRLELQAVTWADVVRDVLGTPWPHLGLALALTAVNYLVLTGYDLLAFRTIGKVLPASHVAGAAFLAYAISHNVGFAALSGASVRFRFYSRWGVTAEELARIVISYSTTFWIGLLFLGGVSLTVSTLPAALLLAPVPVVRASGAALVGLVAAYLVAAWIRRTPIVVRGFSFDLPAPLLAVGQFLLSVTDWVLAGAVLYVLLPVGAPPFLTFVGAFLVAVLIGMLSHVPGGMGVFESLLVVLLKPWLPASALVPAFVVYRVVYYLLPFGAGLLALAIDEARQRRAGLTRAVARVGQLTRDLVPSLLSAVTFFAGVVLVASGATPAAPGRLDFVGRVFPVGAIETSHFLGSIAGAGLLVVAHGLRRRLDAAFYLAAGLIVAGMVASLVKGADIEEAVLLLLVLAALVRARSAFDRRAAFYAARFSPAWLAALGGALGASIWLGFFAFKHVDYSTDLWWRFELAGEASRFLRASVGAAVVVLLAGVAQLIGHPTRELERPDDDSVDRAAGIVALQPQTGGNLVFLRDKGLIFDPSERGFVMYGVQGRSWVAMGDPVGPPEVHAPLIRAFLERADDYGASPMFYEVGHSGLHEYADVGLALVKLGEEALVDLRPFGLDGGAGSRFRQTVRRLEREGGSFRILPPGDAAAAVPRLREISDEWLVHKAVAEKGFSLGFFDEDYLRRFPIGVVERDGVIQAFANLWPGAAGHELSVDLMRYSADAPKGVMEALLVHLMLWGKEQGYRRFSLGMAPLSGFRDSPVASRWHRTGAFLYEHAERVYGFQGLRAFKEKFNPVWEPRYLACQGGLALPRAVADVSALIAGGYRQIFMK